MYAVTVTAQVANIRGGGGTSNVLVALDGGGEQLLTFSSRPTYLEDLPPEVRHDVGKTLVVSKVSSRDWGQLKKQGAKLTVIRSRQRGEHGNKQAPSAKGKESGKLTDEQQLQSDLLQKLEGIGGKTADRLVSEHGVTLESLATADPSTLGKDGSELPPAQIKAVQAYQQAVQQDPELPSSLRSQLKAERVG